MTVISATCLPSITRGENITLLVSRTIHNLTRHNLESVCHTYLVCRGLVNYNNDDIYPGSPLALAVFSSILKTVMFAPNSWIVNVCKIEITITSKTRTQKICFVMCRFIIARISSRHTREVFSEKSTTGKLVKFEESLRERILIYQMTKYAVEVWPVI